MACQETKTWGLLKAFSHRPLPCQNLCGAILCSLNLHPMEDLFHNLRILILSRFTQPGWAAHYMRLPMPITKPLMYFTNIAEHWLHVQCAGNTQIAEHTVAAPETCSCIYGKRPYQTNQQCDVTGAAVEWYLKHPSSNLGQRVVNPSWGEGGRRWGVLGKTGHVTGLFHRMN